MTTVVFDGTYLSADSKRSLRSRGSFKCSECDSEYDHTYNHTAKLEIHKNVKFKDQAVIASAVCGQVGVGNTLRLALNNHIDMNLAIKIMSGGGHGKLSTAVLVVLTDVSLWEVKYDDGLTVKEITKFPYAVGTGGSAALLAIKALNKRAPEAVEQAITVDQFSGGTVHWTSRTDRELRTLEQLPPLAARRRSRS